MIASVLGLLGSARAALGDSEGAASFFAEALEIQRRRLGPEHPITALTLSRAAAVGIATDPEGAYESASKALEVLSRERGGSWQEAEATGHLGAALVALGRYAEAERHLQTAYERLKALRGESIVYTRTARRRLAELHEQWGSTGPKREKDDP